MVQRTDIASFDTVARAELQRTHVPEPCRAARSVVLLRLGRRDVVGGQGLRAALGENLWRGHGGYVRYIRCGSLGEKLLRAWRGGHSEVEAQRLGGIERLGHVAARGPSGAWGAVAAESQPWTQPWTQPGGRDDMM